LLLPELVKNNMPVTVTKKDGGYQVSTPNQVHAKKTSLRNALAQKRLLNAIEHDPNFKPRK
jgi:hypothetical protein